MLIVLSAEGVPASALEVIVYAKVETGWCSDQDTHGELIVSSTIPNGVIERKVRCYFYQQSAWSYNSENICLPVGGNGPRSITAFLKGPRSGGISASVTVVGYHM